MLLVRTIKSFAIIGILLYVISFVFWNDSISFYNLVSFFTFISYALLLFSFIGREEKIYNKTNLAVTTFVFSLVFVLIFFSVSDYYTGNTFLFSEVDARKYEYHSMIMKDMSFFNALQYISAIWSYDDWGAPMAIAFVMKIFPFKFFLNFIYIILNKINACLLFEIGKNIMSKQYAYLASLSFSVASYSIFFMGSFLKEEIMIFLVIVSMYFLYKYWSTHNIIYIVLGMVVSSFVIFLSPLTSL